MTSKFDSLKVSPEEFYKSRIDPFKIKRSRIEKNKARLFGLHIRNCNPSVVLDIGCGEGHFTEYYNSFIPEATFYGCDISDTAIERAVGLGSSVRYFNQDLCGRHPEKYLKHKFDTVICSEVLYYLPNDQMNKAVNVISMFGKKGSNLLICNSQGFSPPEIVEMFSTFYNVKGLDTHRLFKKLYTSIIHLVKK